MIALDSCDNSMTNIILATIRDADEQCNDFRNKRMDVVGELLGRELWANIHLKTLWMLIPVKFQQRKLQSNSFRADNRKLQMEDFSHRSRRVTIQRYFRQLMKTLFSSLHILQWKLQSDDFHTPQQLKLGLLNNDPCNTLQKKLQVN